MIYSTELSFAQNADLEDPLKDFRQQFYFPQTAKNKESLYFCGNSLGLQPKNVQALIEQELKDWAALGVEGHFKPQTPWMPYHEFVTGPLAQVVGAKPSEVVAMNSLTVNLHLLMVSFYRPHQKRYKIIMEGGAFPSDQYAIKSQIRFHDYAPDTALVEIFPRAGETHLRPEDILATIEREGNQTALVLMSGVHYLTGELFPLKDIVQLAHQKGARVGFDLAHAAGNVPLHLHNLGADFAVWCSYKYLNAGPGAIGGAFVHERHHQQYLPRFAGWWGHNKNTRFQMGPEFDPIPTVEAWQLSNPPIFQLAALRGSLELFQKASIERLRHKSLKLTGLLEFLLQHHLSQKVQILTPKDPEQRGCQLSLRIKGFDEQKGRHLLGKLGEEGVICDFRMPDIIRVAPVPLYNSFEDVHRFVEILRKLL